MAYSPDGMNWAESPKNPVGPGLEQTGLIRWNGYYYVNGQGGSHFSSGRYLATFASKDFETWTQASCLGLRRDSIAPPPMHTEWNVGEEVHVGAGLWNRGTVIIGVFDMLHGHFSSDRMLIGMDIGLAISHDALHYHQPIPDFRFVAAYEEEGAIRGKPPTVSHGQGMCNIGDKTFLWYENYGSPPMQVRLATWFRDRIGYFEAMRKSGGHLVTCPLRHDGTAWIWANVEGLHEYNRMTVELLDDGFHPISGYSGDDAAVIAPTEAYDSRAARQRVPGDAGGEQASEVPGLHVPVKWKKGPIPAGRGEVRLKVNLSGIRPEDIKLYALYVEG